MKYRIERSDDGAWTIADVWKRGTAILQDGLLNKGSAFTVAERQLFELDGMLPHQHTDRETQVQRAYEHIQAKGSNPLEKYVGMAALQDRNETLFFQVLSEHVEEMVPIVYTPTVGEAAVRFSHLFRRGRGLWITPDHRGRIFDVLGHGRNEEMRLIVVTDNERILGLGDQGAGGMVIPIGKLALYTLGAGIHPAHVLPISLDVGTDNEALLTDPLYVGWPHRRLRGEEYDSLVDEFVTAVTRRFPGALLQWEDFKKANAFRLLDRYRTTLPSFNDDIQGTAAVVVAGLHAACRGLGVKLEDQRFLLVGAGAAGVGIARHLRHDLEAAGLSATAVLRAVALTDSHGLVVDTRADLEDYKRPLAWPHELSKQNGLDGGAEPLATIVDRYRPTVLIGTTGQPGIFDEAVISTMMRHADRPVVMALSNPTSKCEADPREVVEWTAGAAVIATGSPFEPVEHGGRLIPVSQCNNVYVFPGVGLGAMLCGASVVTDAMFAAAARTLAELVSEQDLRAGRLFPPIEQLRPISRRIAAAVAREGCAVGQAMSADEIDRALDHEIWNLDYPRLMPV